MDLAEITPLVLTYNEEINIRRTLDALSWARQILVIDSQSTDRTLEYIAQYKNARVIERPFDSLMAQFNFGLEQVTTPWVINLDADFACPASLPAELQQLEPTYNAYQAGFTFCIGGKPLWGSMLPPRVMLFRTDRFRYKQDGHTHRLVVHEPTGWLKSVILHDDRKPIARWLALQVKYTELEVGKLLTSSASELSWQDRLRKKIVWAPLLTPFYCLFRKGLILDGWPGIFYTMQRVYAELLLSMKLLEKKLEAMQEPSTESRAPIISQNTARPDRGQPSAEVAARS
jgi:glycosyltransferase involved in cell wall biosynthesis